MSSPPTHKVATDPLSELRLVLESHAFGVESYVLLEAESFPASAAERALVAAAARGGTALVEGAEIRAIASVALLGGEGTLRVRLDARGYTVRASGS